VSSEREQAVRRAEHLVRQGRLEEAIGEYARILEQFPHDLATANTLGDLYVRAAQSDRALPLFLRIADNYFREGFYSKAAGCYKKILKFQPQDETSLLKLGELSLRQGLGADARAYFAPVLARRRQRKDTAGADELLVLIGEASPGDLGARADAARASLRLHGRRAAGVVRETASMLAQGGRRDEAMELLEGLLAADPTDAGARAELVRWAIDADSLDRARQWLDVDGISADRTLTLLQDEVNAIEDVRLADLETPAGPAPAGPRAGGPATPAAGQDSPVVDARRPPDPAAASSQAGVEATPTAPAPEGHAGSVHLDEEVDLTAALNALVSAAPDAQDGAAPHGPDPASAGRAGRDRREDDAAGGGNPAGREPSGGGASSTP
jgi:tetratricopeptide (TPR) repeat protein